MSLYKISFLSGISTAVNLIVRLITNKIVAVYLGTNGMFLLGQLKDFISLSKVTGSFGTTNGIITNVASYKSNPKALESFLEAGLKIHLYISLIVGILIFLFKDSICLYLFDDLRFSNAILLLSFSIISLVLTSFIMAIINGLKQIKTFVKINITASILSALIMIFLVLKYNIIGAFYAICLNQILVFIITIAFARNYHYLKFNFSSLKVDRLHFKNLSKYSYMAIVAPICMVGATLFIRFYLNQSLGDSFAGSWEGMWRLSAIYMMFLTTTFQFYLLPTFSEISGWELKKEVFKIWKVSLPIISSISVFVYLLKDILIPFLFSKEFLLINSILLFHLLGDVIKINSWVLGNILVAKAHTKVFIYFQIGWAILFCSFTILLVNIYGFVGVSIAYFLTYLLHFIAMNLYFRKLLWKKTS